MEGSFLGVMVDFFVEVIRGLDSGVLFFGGPLDIVRYVFDILLITFLMYHLLRLLRQTRAWQLLKGLILIVLFVMLCSVLGLEMVGYIFNNILYIVAIALLIIFQPELRRALEAVGLRSFSSLSNAIIMEDSDPTQEKAKAIDEIVLACTNMSRSSTGALIILERNSRLSELIDQDNAVRLDSTLSQIMIESIFYKGSPLHDGAAIVRDSRIIAARCHVPISEGVRLRADLGTRHHAAIGASEMGDAIAVVVSEERGTISLAHNGKLYVMKDGKELQLHLCQIFGIVSENLSLGQRIIKRYTKKRRSSKKEASKRSATQVCAASGSRKSEALSDVQKTNKPARLRNTRRISARQKILLLLSSVFISISLWTYIQISTNPIMTRTLTIPLEHEGQEELLGRGLAADYPVRNVDIRLVGRESVMEGLSESDVAAVIDFSSIEEPGVSVLDVDIVAQSNVYYRVDRQNPESLSVNIYPRSES